MTYALACPVFSAGAEKEEEHQLADTFKTAAMGDRQILPAKVASHQQAMGRNF